MIQGYKRYLILVSLIFHVHFLFGDIFAYGDSLTIQTENDSLIFVHTHNWNNNKKLHKLWDLTNFDLIFSDSNNLSFVKAFNKKDNTELFSTPSPAFSNIWISDDSKYFIGLSDIMLYNPYQIVIWNITGKLIYKEHISSTVANLSDEELIEFLNNYPETKSIIESRIFNYENKIYVDYSILGMPTIIGADAWRYLYQHDCSHPYSVNFSESVSNWVSWFNSENPDIKIIMDTKKILVISILDPKNERFTIVVNK